MQQKEMSKINECDARECLYNYDGRCSTFAITVGSEEPCCETFMQPQGAAAKGGVRGLTGGVGACHMADCTFNSLLECTAPGIEVVTKAGHPDCGTYKIQ